MASARARTREAVSLLAHRGPDASGISERGEVVLGHTRLSILDLTEAGRQPMESNDGNYAISYNGECYNHRQVAGELGLNALRSASDTEVVLEAFAMRGTSALRQLNGMFAFAVHDRRSRELVLVRDRLGIKPLYYSMTGGELCFASEIRPLLALIGSTPNCDAELLHEWLYYGNPLGGKTLFKGVLQLPPGHTLHLRLDRWHAEVRPYWLLEHQCSLPSSPLRGKCLAGAVRDRLANAVERHLVSDVPVGAFLSGGIDSSAVATFAARHLGSRLRTFCAGFDDPSLPDERPRARWLANRLGTDHQEFLIRGDGMAETVEQLIDCHGTPFSDAANIPLWHMALQVRASVKVVLQGDGGDELFGGYRRYRALRWHRALRALSGTMGPALAFAPSTIPVRRARRYAHAFRQRDLSTTICLLLSPEGSDPRLLECFGRNLRSVVSDADPFEHCRGIAARFARLDPCRRLSMVDLSVELPDIFLEKVDRATMAHGLEARVPFLDGELVDFMVRLPGNLTMPGGRTKWLLKAALRGYVPDEILDGPKTGFNVPFGRWLRGPLRRHFEDHLHALHDRCPGVLDQEVVRELVAVDASGRVDLSSRLWKIYNLAIWANRFRVRFEE
jgi:asparagine synthase (glutamine-hydrolysing)